VRIAAANLLASGQVRGKRANALRLHVGIDDGKWRTYAEVARTLNLSVERVRQLLLSSKLAIGESLDPQFLGRSPTGKLSETSLSVTSARSCCKDLPLAPAETRYHYEACGLSNIFLSGLTIGECQVCNAQSVVIPNIQELHELLAKALILKAGKLRGSELRFLRTTARLTPIAFAAQMEVSSVTILNWERAKVLRYSTDLGTRLVLASLLVNLNLGAEISQLPSLIRRRDPLTNEIEADRSLATGRWMLLSSRLRNFTANPIAGS
jgi:transcriptional regulator with XRE-family HTH domain